MRYCVLLPALALAACTTAPAVPVQAVDATDVDPAALRALPPGVSTRDIGLQGGCYVYLDADGKPVPLVTSRGQQVCV